ncbi:Hypothetical predicted protein [Mytilus galloprovincialis]|uniref:Mab-21-like nucleotidyltransferase domain-containing protein n=1 Tax=Mytilus galloprovincialis TaxID=29158 RepID=A0A8B6E7R7_MYTGA|nr:Hypothetical predicted protein [Mytilus galloprovincialis]
MKTDDVKPGYTQLEVEYNRDQYFSKCCEELNGKHYISSTLFKQQFLLGKNVTIHGPCISDNEGLLDYAVCVHCKTWVSQATHWITRSNNSWPSNDVKHNILKHGVLFAAIGVKGSPKEDLEWRISFSVGEKLLINTFTHTQLICYALLKIILKDVIATDPECEDLLSSYFLKTIIFWISEEIPQCNINHDAVSGWLMLASFFYKTKQYTKALRILENLYPFMVMLETHQQLFKYESLQQKSIVHLWKLLLVDFTCFEQHSVLIPDELQIEVAGRPFFSSSSVYVYFLSFLCHYHLNNIRQCHDSLSNLRTVISENHLIADPEMIASAYDLLGVAFQVLGYTESARQAFSQSIDLYQDPFDNSAEKILLSMS